MVVLHPGHTGDQTPGPGEATFAGSGERVPDADLSGLLADSVISRIVTDAAATPIEVSTKVRTVPAGLWTALVVRDGGCTWPGCTAPAAWCDVAHGNRAYRDDGRLHLGDCALLCRRHHRLFDRGGWTLQVEGPDVHYQRTPATTGRAPP
jgi:hypothetical protein